MEEQANLNNDKELRLVFLRHANDELRYLESGKFLNPISTSPRELYEVVYRPVYKSEFIQLIN